MERRGFLGTVGAVLGALILPWKEMPSFQKEQQAEHVEYYSPDGIGFGSIHVPAEPVPRQVKFSYKNHPTVEGPIIPAGRGMDIPFADQEELTGIEVVYPEGTYRVGDPIEYEVKSATA